MAEDDRTTFFEIIQERNSLAGVKRNRKPHRPSKPCEYEGCNGWAWAQGYCGTHYQKMKREGKIQNKRILNDPVRRFYSKIAVHPETLCWEWQGNIHPRGYPIMGIGGRAQGIKVHRFSYQLFHGDIPPGIQVMHACDNPKCSNPDHLSLGTAKDNMMDASRKGRLIGRPSRKLTQQMIATLRVLYARGNHPVSTLAWIYGIDETTCWAMVKGRSHTADRRTVSREKKPFARGRETDCYLVF